MEIEEAYDGDLPDRFVVGMPSRSTTYHTEVCGSVISSLKNHNRKAVAKENRIKELTDSMVEYHDLKQCSWCARISSDGVNDE